MFEFIMFKNKSGMSQTLHKRYNINVILMCICSELFYLLCSKRSGSSYDRMRLIFKTILKFKYNSVHLVFCQLFDGLFNIFIPVEMKKIVIMHCPELHFRPVLN